MGSLEYEVVDEEGNEEATNSSTNDVKSSIPSSLLTFNHVSYICKSLPESIKFYGDVLGFKPIKRPAFFKFVGAWLYNPSVGVGIHFLEIDSHERNTGKIEVKDNHISFQCSDMSLMIARLESMGIEYITQTVTDDDGITTIDQVFFHDPDGYMVEFCNCENIPIRPFPDHVLSED